MHTYQLSKALSQILDKFTRYTASAPYAQRCHSWCLKANMCDICKFISTYGSTTLLTALRSLSKHGAQERAEAALVQRCMCCLTEFDIQSCVQVVWVWEWEEEVGLGGGCHWAAYAATVPENIQCHSWAGACQNPGARDYLPYRLAVYIAGLEERRCAEYT